MFKTTAITGLVLATALASGQAFANTPDDGVKAQRVSYGDLNLSRERDARKLVKRIHNAASQVCSLPGDRAMDRLSGSYRTCVQIASEKAISGLNNPMVTAAYESRSPYEVATK